MNTWILLLLLLCNSDGCGCQRNNSCGNNSGRSGRDRDCDRGNDRGRDCDCGNDRSRDCDRGNDNDCDGNDSRFEPRFDARPFGSGENCGCES